MNTELFVCKFQFQTENNRPFFFLGFGGDRVDELEVLHQGDDGGVLRAEGHVPGSNQQVRPSRLHISLSLEHHHVLAHFRSVSFCFFLGLFSFRSESTIPSVTVFPFLHCPQTASVVLHPSLGTWELYVSCARLTSSRRTCMCYLTSTSPLFQRPTVFSTPPPLVEPVVFDVSRLPRG